MRKTLIAIGLFVVALVVAIWYFSNIFFYITFSLVIATLLRPLTNWVLKLEVSGRTIPRGLAVFVSFLAVAGVIGAFITLFIPLISHQVDVISRIDFEIVFEKLFQPLRSIEDFLIAKDLVSEDSGFLKEAIHDAVFNYAGRVKLGDVINSLFSVAGNFFVGILAVGFITFFLLYEKGIIRRVFISIIPNQYFEVFINALYKMEKLLSNYLLGLLFQMISIFTIAGVGLSILGIDYAVTVAVFAAVANLIPYLGPLLGGLFGILVAVSASGDFAFSNETIILIVKVFSVFAVVQVTDNVLLQPLIFSKSVKAHPLEIFVIIFVGASIAGIPGMIAAIPVYTILRVSTSEIYAGFNQYRVFKIKN
ncbi:AI-2E family transporter [Marinoscillum sp. MHG1-6]|uniref:AI-2E family transporter n=1 Tax=Marinoscillum sp. MHG1-6 TaxID=2959627 RepID=UPI0021579A91|nr:AI-2E family transporter [Marinoscillum sp. MHG1-6]